MVKSNNTCLLCSNKIKAQFEKEHCFSCENIDSTVRVVFKTILAQDQYSKKSKEFWKRRFVDFFLADF